MRRTLLSAMAVVAVALSSPIGLAGTAEAVTVTWTNPYSIANTAVTTSSGLASGTYGRAVLYTHNTGGGTNKIFGFWNNSGATATTLTVKNSNGGNMGNIGWEDIAAGKPSTHKIWIGDVGDPNRSRVNLNAISFAEPATNVATANVTGIKYPLAYADGVKRDAQAMLVNPANGRIYVITKEAAGAGIYAAPTSLSTTVTNPLTLVASAPPNITGGSWAPDGSRFVLVSPTAAYVYASVDAVPVVVNVPSQLPNIQGVGFGASGYGIYVSSEGTRAIYKTTSPGAASGWTPAWTDDFSSLDTTRWNVRDHDYASNNQACWEADAVSIDSGALRIQASDVPCVVSASTTMPYTSGYVDTIGKASLADYFRLEVRAKVPLEEGMWAAPVWFRPDGGGDGEIDLIETWGWDSRDFGAYRIHQDIHGTYAPSQHDPFMTEYAFDPAAWHTYVIEKTPGRIDMSVDGIATHSWTSSSPSWYDAYFEAGRTWNLRVNLQVGGARGLPDASTDWTPDLTAMKLDYIKTWTYTP
ncbi:MAG: glycoside hydrolase family 16 protein [Nocardioides sp.]